MERIVVDKTAAGAIESPISPSTKIKVRGLDFYYGQNLALKKVDLDIDANHVTAIIGPSGCGKSTLLRTLNRIHDLYPGLRTEGEILLDGENILGRGIDTSDLRARVGMVFQKPTPFNLSIFENIAFPLRNYEKLSRAEQSERVERALRQAALWDEVKDKLQVSALSLSGGQQQRLCIARSLAVQPEVLLLDEPTSALDPISTARIEELLYIIRENLTVVIVTHNLQQAARIGDKVVFMLNGEVIEVGDQDRMFNNPKDERTMNYITGRFG